MAHIEPLTRLNSGAHVAQQNLTKDSNWPSLYPFVLAIVQVEAGEQSARVFDDRLNTSRLEGLIRMPEFHGSADSKIAPDAACKHAAHEVSSPWY